MEKRGLFRALTSAMVSRMQFASQHGQTFQGSRDLYEACGYPRVITPQMYAWQYRRDGIAARIVEAYPDATWRGKGEVYDDQDPEVSSPFEQAFDELNKRLHIWHVFHRADILAGQGKYAVVLIGAPGDLSTPLGTGLGAESVAFLQPFAQTSARISSFEEEIKSERFGLPKEYYLGGQSLEDRAPTELQSPFGVQNSRPCHFSRVLHLAEGLLSDNVYGIPRLERVWNRLLDLDKVTAGGSEAYWQRVNQGLQFDLDKEVEFKEGEEQAFSDEISEFMHGMRRYFRTRGVKVNSFASDVSMFGSNASSIIAQISAATKIPQRLLLGSERGELASTQDRVAWAERVQDRRMQFAEPMVVRPLIDAFIACGALPEPKDGEYEVAWPEVLDMSLDERLTLAGKAVALNVKGTVITPQEIRDEFLDMEPLEEEKLAQSDPNADPAAQGQSADAVATVQNRPSSIPAAAAQRPHAVGFTGPAAQSARLEVGRLDQYLDGLTLRTSKDLSKKRAPKPFEVRLLSLKEIPEYLDGLTSGLVERLSSNLSNQNEFDQALRTAVSASATFGAEEVRKEAIRQSYSADSVTVDVSALSASLIEDATQDLKEMRRKIVRRLSRRTLSERARALRAAEESAKYGESIAKRVARDAVNAAFGAGRTAALHALKGLKIREIVQTAILDGSLCEECAAVDGEVAQWGSERQLELEPPYYKCLGRDNCRCVQVAILSDKTMVEISDHGKDVEEYAPEEYQVNPKKRLAGGAGSGNFGHAGRPGEVGGSSSLEEQAVAIEAMPEHVRDNTDFYSKGMARGYALYEARTMMPKQEGKLKKISDRNSFMLYQDADGVVNFQGEPLLAHAYDDPDDGKDEGLKVWAFTDPRRPYDTIETSTYDLAEALKEYASKVALRSGGGQGSGNFGHEGRPGEVGGSGATSGFKEADPKNAKDAARMKELRIPPAWTSVRLNPNPNGELQAVGKDSKDRTQYRYSAEHSEKAAAEKFARLKDFNEVLPDLRKQIEEDRFSEDHDVREAASVLSLIDKTGFRIGSDQDTQAEKDAKGATTLEAKDVRVHGDRVDFKFVGKKGVLIEKTVQDRELALMLHERASQRGRLFDTSDAKVRSYLAQKAEGFTPKDFRTWHGTAEALKMVAKMPRPEGEKAFRSSQREVAKHVANFLGNTPTVALASYIDPAVFSRWRAK